MNSFFVTIVVAILGVGASCKTIRSGGERSNVASGGDGVPAESRRARTEFMSRVDGAIASTFDYLQNLQRVKTPPRPLEVGKWGGEMIYRRPTLIFDMLAIEPGTRTYDNNCFETSSTAIILADLYLKHHGIDPTRLDKVVPMLDLAMPKIKECQVETGGFAFWPLMDRETKLSKGIDPELKIRGPKYFPYKTYFSQLQSNNFADEDDTGLALQAFIKHNQVKRKTTGRDSVFAKDVIKPLAPFYQKYVHGNGDYKAKYANEIPGNVDNVFLVWWGEPSLVPVAAYVDEPVLPMNFNVIDCVASANALGALNANGERMDHPSYQATCDYVNRMVAKSQDKKCALYYPSTYNLHYAIASALENGATCLEPSRKLLLADLHNTQIAGEVGPGTAAGSWPPFNDIAEDSQQTAMFALSAYLKLADPKDLLNAYQKNLVYRAAYYLLHNHAGNASQGIPIHWKPGIHFSAGPSISESDGLRDVTVWTSPGFTNAQMLEILYKLKEIYPDGELVPEKL